MPRIYLGFDPNREVEEKHRRKVAEKFAGIVAIIREIDNRKKEQS